MAPPPTTPRDPMLPNEMQRAGHVLEQEANGQQVEEHAEGSPRSRSGSSLLRARGSRLELRSMLAPYQLARAGMKRCISP